MPWSVNIGSIAGTAVRIHITFLLFLVWIFIAGYITGGRRSRLGEPGLHHPAVRLRAGA